MKDIRIRINVFWLIVWRTIIATILVIAAVIIQYSTSVFLDLEHFYVVVLVLYALSLIYFILFLSKKFIDAQVYFQIICDILLISAIVYITGGLKGSFYFLYIFEIVIAGIILTRRAAYITAALSAICFGLLVDGMYLGLIPLFGHASDMEISQGMAINNIFLAWTVFFLVALLINRLMRNYRRMRDELHLAQKELEIKKHLAMAGEISASLAHEIRNPLAAVSGSIQVLRDELKLSGEQKNLMDIVVSETDRVSQTVDQFLNLAAAGHQAFEWLDVGEVLDETLTLLKQSGELNGLHRLQGNFLTAKMSLYGNRHQLKQIFWNLTKNALKAMPEGGTLTVDISRQKNKNILITFRDNGKGMTKEERENLFRPFYSRFKSGMGIGMSVVRRIVDECRGRIRVASEPNLGTEVQISLPQRQSRIWV